MLMLTLVVLPQWQIALNALDCHSISEMSGHH